MRITALWLKNNKEKPMPHLQGHLVLILTFRDCNREVALRCAGEFQQYIEMWYDDGKLFAQKSGDQQELFLLSFDRIKGKVTIQKAEIMHYVRQFVRHCQRDPECWEENLDEELNRRSQRFADQVIRAAEEQHPQHSHRTSGR